MTAIENLTVKVIRESTPPRLVTFGLGGCSVYYASHHFSTGNHNGTPEHFFQPWKWWAHPYRSQRDPKQWEGVPFVDMREAAGTHAGIHNAICGPMVDVELTPENTPANPGSFGYVCIEEYSRRWKAVGATIGTIQNGQFVAAN